MVSIERLHMASRRPSTIITVWCLPPPPQKIFYFYFGTMSSFLKEIMLFGSIKYGRRENALFYLQNAQLGSLYITTRTTETTEFYFEQKFRTGNEHSKSSSSEKLSSSDVQFWHLTVG